MVVSLLFIYSKWFKRRRFQEGLALVGIGCFLASAAIMLLGGRQDGFRLVVALVLQGCQTGCFIVFWGLGFASLNKGDAERMVVVAVLVAFALYGLGGLVPVSAGGVFLAGIMKVAGTLPFLLGLYDMPVVDREPVASNYSLLVPFFASRVFFGVCMGVASCAALFSNPDLPAASPMLSFVLFVSLGAGSMWCYARSRRIAPVLWVAPLVIAGLILFPYLAGDSVLDVLGASATTMVFLSWIVLSSIQLSDIKERIGWDEARLSFAEKAVFSAGWLTAFLAMFVFCGMFDEASLAPIASRLSMFALYSSILVASYLMASLIERKDKARVLDKALKLSENQFSIIYGEIAAEYGLTAREQEVLAMVAKGYTRPLICEKLVIAESTARSHIKHVYQKLDIHSREELYDLVEKRQQRFSSEKGDL